jgi:GntR family transcriptional regulator
LPAHAQIKEQIKLALLLGRLRPGDTLPSIRDVERDSDISRNIVRKAYLDLQHAGILTLRHGKGVMVEKHLSYAQRDKIMKKCETLSQRTLKQAARLGLAPSAFSRYLYQQARDLENQTPSLIFVDATKNTALDRATKISNIWHVTIPGLSVEELDALRPAALKNTGKILTNYLRLDEVTRIAQGSGVDVIPLSLSFTSTMLGEFDRLPSRATVVLVLDDRDYPSLKLILESYRKVLVDPSVKLISLPYSKARNLNQLVKSGKYQKIIISNRVWDKLPDAVKNQPTVTRPQMEIDLASLESARIRAGVIV